jgi:plasmid stability protein
VVNPVSGAAAGTDRITTAERLAEVAEILAAGVLRLRRKQGQVPATEEQVRLDFPPERSVHADRLTPRRAIR